MKDINKNKFQKRTIQPSEDSWAKLDSRLTAFERVKNKIKWIFLKYAASILIIFLVGFYFTQTTNHTAEKDVVVQPVIKVNELKIQPIIEESEKVLVASNPKEILNKPIQKGKIKKAINRKQGTEMAVLKTLNTKEIVNKIAISEAIVNTQISRVDSLEDQKIKELVAEMKSIKKEKGEVTDLEIEQLLVTAQKSLFAGHKIEQNKKFNSANLLAEVEYDLDKDFKKRLFEAIVNTLKEPKNIFVNRDN
ncbi:MAG: hypothetical protein COC22_01220 [Flavobacteriaceae bacterium]|nr:MAG: hypothetical protein COC22_01220 [Flavobacteriaceae bacterium]